jgi:hypothetical protein
VMPFNNYASVAWSDALGLAAAVGVNGPNGREATSPGGITWTEHPIAAGAWRGVAAAPSAALFAAVGTNVAASSVDGSTWTTRTIPVGGWTAVVHA